MRLNLERFGDLEGQLAVETSSVFGSFRFGEVGVGLGKTIPGGYTYSPEAGAERIPER
ncbi:hypothetical protein LF1_20170 [Rubripirellula obstinata]|uniref:Uncharacterized protein n=1 Tax=Rubripirellula obstinata TaxID=406547 RepID=A0A5B1CJ56_9BACT|nr:hypothetical protein LF1_20170 [Rubripirellula obstinata]